MKYQWWCPFCEFQFVRDLELQPGIQIFDTHAICNPCLCEKDLKVRLVLEQVEEEIGSEK